MSHVEDKAPMGRFNLPSTEHFDLLDPDTGYWLTRSIQGVFANRNEWPVGTEAWRPNETEAEEPVDVARPVGSEAPTRILNLTQHDATPDQREAGVVDIDNDHLKAELRKILTFDSPPTEDEMRVRAFEVARMAKMHGAHTVMIGGAPYFMPTLVRVLKSVYLEPVFAFSKRVTQERRLVDGSVDKSTVFKHEGFVRSP